MAGLWCLGDQQYGCLGSLSPPGSRVRRGRADGDIARTNIWLRRFGVWMEKTPEKPETSGSLMDFRWFSYCFHGEVRKRQTWHGRIGRKWIRDPSCRPFYDFFPGLFDQRFKNQEWQTKNCCRLLGAPTYRTRPRDVWKLHNFQFQASNTFAKRVKTTNCLVKVETFHVYTYYILYHTISIVLYLYGNWSLIYIYICIHIII